MAREYCVSDQGLTLANAAVTLAFINPGTTCSLEFLRAWCSQAGTATSNQQRVRVVTQVTAFPTLTGNTPTKLKLLDPISQIVSGTAGAAGTAGVNASAEGAGTKTAIFGDAFNVLNGWLWVPTPRETMMMNAGAASGWGLNLPVAAVSLTSWQVGVIFSELG